MEITSSINDLLSHMEWADALVWTTVLSSPVAASDAALRDRLHHVHGTQHAFLQVWLGITSETPPKGFSETGDLARWARQYYAQLGTTDGASVIEGRLDEAIPASLIQAAEAGLGPSAITPSMGDTVLQVVMHTMYHRGQIITRLRDLGCDPPLTEYFVWVWLGKPGPNWPAAAS